MRHIAVPGFATAPCNGLVEEELRPALPAADPPGRTHRSLPIVNTTGQLIDGTRPARAGDSVQIYCTGLGATNPLIPTGQAASSATPAVVQPTVMIGGISATVQYAGLAPGFVGLYQINAVVPAGLSGSSADVVISGAGATSRSGVTLAVTR